MLIALFTGGHLLLQGVPGVGKTLLVNAVAKAISLAFSRVQFTIDMLPSDIVGSEILDQAKGSFRIHKGPVFTNLLLADEINRAARKVTIGNTTYPLPLPFLVIATQNPIEQAGTFELPEAQLDRFMLCHRLDYPTLNEEEEILNRQLSMGLRTDDRGAVPKTAFDMIQDEACCSVEDLTQGMAAVQKIYVSDVFIRHCVEIVRKTRKHPALEVGASPRAAMALVQTARARAYILGRDYVIPEDLLALAEDVMLHRIRLNYASLAEGMDGRRVLNEVLADLG
jgi:MoxR-like ATPase